eukprot:78737_1
MGSCLTSQNDAEPELVIKSDTIDVVSQYKFGRTLGSGESASVVQATHKEHKEDVVAVKIMEKNKKGRDILYKREVTVFEQLIPDVTNPPPGILPFKAHGEDKDAFYIVTGLLEGGELFDRIVSREDEYKINERIAFPLVGDMSVVITGMFLVYKGHGFIFKPLPLRQVCNRTGLYQYLQLAWPSGVQI